MSYYVELQFKVKDLDLFSKVLQSRGAKLVNQRDYGSSTIEQYYVLDNNMFDIAYNKNEQTVLYDPDNKWLKDFLLSCQGEYATLLVQDFARRNGLMVVEQQEYDDRIEIILEDF